MPGQIPEQFWKKYMNFFFLLKFIKGHFKVIAKQGFNKM